MNKRNDFLNLVSLEGEVWKSVNYVDNNSGEVVVDENYYISNLGRVVSFQTSNPKFIKPQIQNAGYSIIKVAGKWRTLHRIVAHLYVEYIDGKTQIDHINRDKQDNRSVNLRWVNRGENRKNSAHKRTMQEIIADGSSGIATIVNNGDNKKKVYVYDFSGTLLTTYSSINVAAKETLGAWQMISDCISGKKLSYRGVIWLDNEDIWSRLEEIKNSYKRKYQIKEYQAEKLIIPISNIDGSVRLF